MSDLDDTDDYSIDPGDEARFLGVYAWEIHLGEFDRCRLYVARAGLESENEMHFALTHAAVLASAEFIDDLETAGDDPTERALVRLEAELNSYW